MLPANVHHADPAPGSLPVLIVDDSAVARAVLTRVVDQSGDFHVVGSVGSVPRALDFLAKNRVSYVLLDIMMPGTDGLTALPDMIAAAHDAKVVMVSGSVDAGAACVVQALALGAVDTMLKPAFGSSTKSFGVDLIEKMRRIEAGVRTPGVVRHPVAAEGRVVAPPLNPPIKMRKADFDVIAIGASTGGIHALSKLLRAVPVDRDVPILITQHLPTSFMPYFAAQIAVLSGRPCDVAVDRMQIRAGRIIVAPGDKHLRCRRDTRGNPIVLLTGETVASGCLPSVDPMLASVAATYGDRTLAVVLSGMGRDGAQGVVAVADAGGTIVVQDEASSVVWGMPGAAMATGVAAAMLEPAAIGQMIASGCRAS
ncbi:MAG: response regulator [Sphingomonas bacterium]|nr:response regulator [Sphingomonas bacterium]